MKVIMFQPRFAPLVASGAKPHTIRKQRKNPIKVGDKLSLRTWLGKPYRSKQKVLREGFCICTRGIEITNLGFSVSVYGRDKWLILDIESCDKLAKKDGFANAGEMIQWFRDTHGLPFEGVLIEWSLTPPPE
jgi:hypothetical protein